MYNTGWPIKNVPDYKTRKLQEIFSEQTFVDKYTEITVDILYFNQDSQVKRSLLNNERPGGC